MDVILYLLLVLFLAAAAVVGAVFIRSYLTGTSPTAAIFRPRPEKRLDIVEQSNLDGRRRLVLIRRDDVEHLIMTGGPVDVVIETNIVERRGRTSEAADSSGHAPLFSRPPRTLGQAAADH